MELNILVDVPVFEPTLNVLLADKRLSIHCIENPEEKERELPESIIRNCDVLFCSFLPLNHSSMEQLKYIQIASAGFNQLVGKGLRDKSIVACNALGVFDVPIAEWNIAMMINLARDLRSMVRNQEQQVWDRSERFQTEIRGKVVGLWGYGGIGRETARLAKAMGMQVHVLTRQGLKARENTYRVADSGDQYSEFPDQVFTYNEKETFLAGLDFLVLAVPLNSETEGMISEPELAMLPKHCCLLNPARGPLIQESALIKALEEKWIAGAALDTHYYYPLPTTHPFWYMDHVIITPHISGSSGSPKFLERVWDIFQYNLNQLSKGRSLINEIPKNCL